MKLLLKLAWRNIWRNKRRSIITILAVFFAALLSIGMRGLQLGTYAVNIDNAVSLWSGYGQVQRPGYRDNPSLRKSFQLNKDLIKIIQSDVEITGYAPRIYADGLVSFKENSYGTALFGLVPQYEKKVTVILNKMQQGRFFQSDTSAEVVLGFKLLKNLRASIGDTIVILSQGYDGILGNLKFRIVGSIKTGSPDLDAMAVFMGLSKLQELLAMEGRISVLALSIKHLDAIPGAISRLNTALQGRDLVALSWDEVLPELKQLIELDNVSGILTLAILVVVVAFGILNTVLMSVTERFREFGVILAIGMPQKKLVIIVLLETAFITFIGLLLGNIAAAGVNYYFVEHPIVFGGQLAELYAEYGFLPRMESSLRFNIFFNSTIAIFIVAILSGVYPLIKVYLLEPLKGIRYT